MPSPTLTRLDLPAELGIPEAEALKSSLLELLAAGNVPELGGNNVRRIGTAAFQVLAALSVELRKSDANLVWHEPSEALRNSARVLGLLDVLNLN